MANDIVSILLASDVFLWLYFGPQSGTLGAALAKESQELLQNVRSSQWYQAYVAESTLDYIAQCIEEEQGLDVAEQVFRTLSQNLQVLAGAATAENLQEIQSQEALLARHNNCEIVSHFAANYAAFAARVRSVEEVLEQLEEVCQSPSGKNFATVIDWNITVSVAPVRIGLFPQEGST